MGQCNDIILHPYLCSRLRERANERSPRLGYSRYRTSHPLSNFPKGTVVWVNPFRSVSVTPWTQPSAGDLNPPRKLHLSKPKSFPQGFESNAEEGLLAYCPIRAINTARPWTVDLS